MKTKRKENGVKLKKGAWSPAGTCRACSYDEMPHACHSDYVHYDAVIPTVCHGPSCDEKVSHTICVRNMKKNHLGSNIDTC